MFIAHRHLLDTSELAAVARLFSPSLLREIAQKGQSPLFSRLVKESGLANVLAPSESVGNLFDAAFSLLSRKKYRHEYVYKAAIAHKILLGVHSLETASMLTEFRVDGCKADIAILNGTSTVYEVKSERDKLDRLQNQVAAYRKAFAKVNVITGENHHKEVLDSVPEDVGVMLLTDRYQISTIREAVDAPERVMPLVIFDALQLRESRQLLELLGMKAPKVPNTQMYREMRKLFEGLDATQVHSAMVEVLKKTRSLQQIRSLVESLPFSLQAVILSAPPRKRDHAKLLDVMSLPIQEALSWA